MLRMGAMQSVHAWHVFKKLQQSQLLKEIKVLHKLAGDDLCILKIKQQFALHFMLIKDMPSEQFFSSNIPIQDNGYYTNH